MHRILIVDDSFIIRRSLRSWLAGQPGWEVCGEAENGLGAVEKVEQLRPDIVILDFQMPGMNGLDAARQIARLAPKTAIVLFTLHPSAGLLEAALQAGVRDVVSKTDRLVDHLSSALHRICV